MVRTAYLFNISLPQCQFMDHNQAKVTSIILSPPQYQISFIPYNTGSYTVQFQIINIGRFSYKVSVVNIPQSVTKQDPPNSITCVQGLELVKQSAG